MKILFTNNPPVIAYGLAQGFEQIGEEVEILPVWLTPWDQQEQLIETAINRFKPDYLFTEGDPPNFNRTMILAAARRHGIPVIYWAIQDPLWFKEVSEYCALNADYVFTTAAELLPVYRQMGKAAKLLLFGCNPAFHQQVGPVTEYQSEVCFVGTNYYLRADVSRWMLEPLVEAGVKLKLWGQGWSNPQEKFHLPNSYDCGILPYNLLPQVYSSAKIVLGMHLDASSTTQTSVRTFEVLGCGSFYLTQYTPAHEHLFTKGIHLEWVKERAEVAELVRYYLTHNEARAKIAKAGQEYVYAKHTFAQRAAEVKEAITHA